MDLARRASRPPAARRLVVAALVVAAGCTSSGPASTDDRAAAPATTVVGAARFLEGRPLAGPTGLRLLVASNPPRLLDVDHGSSRRVGGIPDGQGPFSVSLVGDDAIVAGDREVYVLRRGSSRAILVGTDAADGGHHALVDPGTGRVRARYPEVHGVAGDLVLWGDHERHAGPFTLTDQRTGARHPVARPTPHGWAGFGRASPDGRLLALEFADVSWGRLKGQVSDIWLLDLRTRRWQRLPSMPLITAVKFMSMEWASDGRLVLVGDFDRFGEALAVWRPGQDHLAIRRLDLPDYDGSDSFVAWPAPTA